MSEKLEPVTKEWFDDMKARLEAKGFKVKNKWRKGTTQIHLEDLVLDESAPTSDKAKGGDDGK